MSDSTFARVKFSVRSPATADSWHYDRITLDSPYGGGFTPMHHPPAVGDLIVLSDKHRDDLSGVFRVVERQWVHASYGSASWPLSKPEPADGPLLDIIVEPSEGAYRDEEPES